MASKILIVEDEQAIADNIQYALETDGFDATFRDVFKASLIYESNWAVIVIIHVEPIHFS